MNERKIGPPQDDPAEFERRLSVALRRVDPPSGFTDQMIEAIKQTAEAAEQTASRFGWRPNWHWPWKSPGRRWQLRPALAMAVIALLVIAAGMGYGVYQRHEQAQVARIQSQFETAIAVTSRALDHAQVQLAQPRLWQHFPSALQSISQK